MDTSNTTARFNFIFEPRLCSNSTVENTVLFETKSFAVIPSLGSLVPGWLLVVPKRRVLNCGMLTGEEQSELKELIQKLLEAQQRFTGRVFAFEHGPTYVGSLTGCGVDQAHIHLVPLEFDLVKAATATPGVIWDTSSYDNIVDGVNGLGEEYVAIYDSQRGPGIVGRPIGQTSQWVRRVIAAELGHANDWDYRKAPQRNIIAMTVEALKPTPIKEY